jgi:glutathione gamma-glutamylcysteinyltransferase
MILNSLKVDPDRLWKGPWRWFSDEMLDCCKDLNTIKEKGINFDEFVCIGLCNGADVVAVHASESSEEKFRQAVMQATSSSGHIIAVNYDRRVVKQSGMGHFSPIGAYNKQRDLVLIMDVARYKYPPHWLPVSLVFQAMLSIDSETKRDRGYFILTASPKRRLPVLCRLFGGTAWKILATRLSDEMQQTMKTISPRTPQEFVRVALIQMFHNDIFSLISEYSIIFDTTSIPWEHQEYIEKIKTQLKQTNLYKMIVEILQQLQQESNSYAEVNVSPETAALILFAYTNQLFSSQPDDALKRQVQDHLLPNILPPELQQDVETLSHSIAVLESLCNCGLKCSQCSEGTPNKCCCYAVKTKKKTEQRPDEQTNTNNMSQR